MGMLYLNTSCTPVHCVVRLSWESDRGRRREQMAQKDPCSNDEVVKGVERWDEVATVGGEGGEREEGSVGAEGGERGEDESTKLVDLSLPPVNWTPVRSLHQNYQTTIKKRMPALFRGGSADNSFAGAMYAHSASGQPFGLRDESRIVYFESANPDKPRMRVAKTSEAEDVVLRYSWDRINFVYFDVTHTRGSSVYLFQICTPAISGTYGLKAAKNETLIFEKLPEGENSEDYFTKFQTTTLRRTNPITTTTQNGTALGMYVDTNDGWKVKLTDTSGLWDKFTFPGFIQ